MMSETRTVRATVLGFSAVLLLAACGGSSKTTPPASTGSSSAPAITNTTVPAAKRPVPSTTTPASRARVVCRAGDLALSFIGGQGATGHGLLGFELRNVGSQPCHTYGFPGIQFLDRSGRPLPTATTRTTHDFFGAAPLQALVVAPGTSVSFRVGVTHGMASSAGCTTAAGISVIAPDDTSSLRATMPEGEYECGTATVSPVRPGRSAYP